MYVLLLGKSQGCLTNIVVDFILDKIDGVKFKISDKVHRTRNRQTNLVNCCRHFGVSITPTGSDCRMICGWQYEWIAVRKQMHKVFWLYFGNTYISPDYRYPPSFWAAARNFKRTNNGPESIHAHVNTQY